MKRPRGCVHDLPLGASRLISSDEEMKSLFSIEDVAKPLFQGLVTLVAALAAALDALVAILGVLWTISLLVVALRYVAYQHKRLKITCDLKPQNPVTDGF